jgi:DNA-binding transcriptional ArsR family regulator
VAHEILLSALRNRTLTEASRAVLSYLYAHTNGTLSAQVSIDDICADLGIADSTLRRHRGQLAAAGYLTSERDGDVLTFELRSPSERALGARAVGARAVGERAPSARLEPERAPSERAPSERLAAQRAPSARSERDDAAMFPPNPLLGIVKTKQQQVNSSCCSEEGAGETDARTAQLLRVAGIRPTLVADLAARLTFESAARHVAAWQRARAGKPDLGVGALVERLRTWTVPGGLSATELRAGLLADHVTDDDLVAWGYERAPQYVLPEPREAPAPPLPLWETALSQLRLQLPQGTFEAWVRDLDAEWDEDTLVVYGTPAAVEWLGLRLSRLVEQTLEGINGAPVAVRFAVKGAT